MYNLAGALVSGTLSCGPGLGAPFYKNARCFLKLVQSGKQSNTSSYSDTYVIIKRYVIGKI